MGELVEEKAVLQVLGEFIRSPSVSASATHAAGILSCAAWLASHLHMIGLDHAAVVPTAGHAVVFAEWRQAPGGPTLLIYGHHDVQPPEPLDAWRSPPFTPTVRGEGLYGRGASDDKG
jgi:acetylornithine deacetylase/succinyl-diaminopimelate desuccinylase-like protein